MVGLLPLRKTATGVVELSAPDALFSRIFPGMRSASCGVTVDDVDNANGDVGDSVVIR